MDKAIYKFRDYKRYLEAVLQTEGKQRTGRRSKLAESIGCHTAYVSQVLNGNAHFNLEQADRINQFLGHSKSDAQYLLLIVQFARAGTDSLKAHFTEQINAAIESQAELKGKLTFKRALNKVDQSIYYSAWYYAAAHTAVSIPEIKTKEDVAQLLGISMELTGDILEFLESVGLVLKKGLQYSVGTTSLHLESNSPMTNKHHTNWRIRAIHSLDHKLNKDLHYSSVITASVEDAVKIKAVMVKAIEEIRGVVRDSKDEKVFCYTMDFFNLSET